MAESSSRRLKIAVVGAGVSGLGATWLLNEHSPHEVHLFEEAKRPGGHTNTVTFRRPDNKHAKPVQVDTGFIVLNEATYPNFLRFLRDRKLPIIASDMSFAVTRDHGAYEWAGNSISTVFAQRETLFRASQWRMVWDILRFNTCALEVLNEPGKGDCSIGEYLHRNGYSASFRENYLLPMTAAIWSTPPDDAALDFPAATLIRFMHNHHLMTIANRPSWLTIRNGSKQYVESILEKLPLAQYHQGSAVISISTKSGPKHTLKTADGKTYGDFDRVIMASHADQTLRILKAGEGGATAEEERVLGDFAFSKNKAVLHSDLSMMPIRRPAWAAWNFLSRTGEKGRVNEVALTYWMNLLQSIPEAEHGPVLVTLNPPHPPNPAKVVSEHAYDHPLMTAKSIAAQSMLSEIQNRPERGISFAGAWTKYGFHEDGFRSGLQAAAPFCTPPWPILPAERPHASTLATKLTSASFTIAEVVRRLATMVLYLWLQVLALVTGTAEQSVAKTRKSL